MDSEFDTIVVGAGVWGAAAIEAHEKAGRSVAWIDDKHDEASTASADIVRIIRGEYSDSAYRALGEEAIGIFKTQKPYSDHYHHTGWFMVEDKQQGQHRSVPRGTLDVSAEEFMRSFPSAPPEKLSTLRITKTGNVGWAEANKLQQALHAASRVKVRKGTVSRLVLDDLGRFRGVELDTGEILCGKNVMLATGWRANQLLAPQNFRQVDCRVVGVPKLGIKLTDEQYAKYRDMPILVQQGRGEILPPTPEKIMRINIVTPYYLGPGATATLTPLAATDACFKQGWDFLATFCPDLTGCPAVVARMCWDAFTGSQSFRIEQMGDNVWYLGGGSFHSFKFRPVLPRLIAARLGLNGGDDDGKEWESLMREESKKHADLFPTRCWE